MYQSCRPTTTQRRYSPQSPTCRNPMNLCYNPQHPGKCLKNNVPDIKPPSMGKADIITNILSVRLPRPFLIRQRKRTNPLSMWRVLRHPEKCPASLRPSSRLKSGFLGSRFGIKRIKSQRVYRGGKMQPHSGKQAFGDSAPGQQPAQCQTHAD